ncbi:MAG TPA: hypothetical protein VMG98_00660, partial [Verrucomicrobiae bacterium]|nr:hypothetical protein [Verrucomicrobiae bacterium]
MIQQTTLYDLVKQIRLARPTGTVYMGVYRCDANFAVPEGHHFIYGLPGALGREFVVISTRYESLARVSVPRELVYFCLSLGDDINSARAYLYQVALAVHAICQISANAGSSIIQETLFTEFPFGTWQRFTLQLPYSDVPKFPLGGRFLDQIHTLALAERVWGSGHRDKLLLAISQYQEALSVWRPGAAPLLCLHLWMAVEALTEAVLKAELARPTNIR